MKRKYEDDSEEIYSRVPRGQPNFDKLANAIGKEWRSLGTALGYSSVQLDHLIDIYHDKPFQRNRIMLTKWWEAMTSQTESKQVQQLMRSKLIESDLRIVAEDVISGESLPSGFTWTVDMESFVSKINFDIGSNNFKDEQFQCYIADWKTRDKNYVEPRYFLKAKESFLTHGCVTLVAPSGDGKTATCMHLALQMMTSGYNVLLVKIAEELKKCNPSERTLLILDDPIGKNMLKVEQMQSFLDQTDVLESCINMGKTRVIVTMRKELYNEAKHSIQHTFLGRNCFDMSAECHRLNPTEKQKIMTKHGLSLDKWEMLMSEDYHPGFPFLCHLLSVNDNSDSNKKELDPDPVIKSQIQSLKNSHIHRYCALCLLALYDGVFDEDILSEMAFSQQTSSNLTDVVGSCGLSADENTFCKIRESLDIMEETYVIKDQNGSFQFLHDLIFDAVASVYGSGNILFVIRHFSPAFLQSRIRIADGDVEFGWIKLLPKHFTRFAERICKDLQERYIIEVFMNPSILDTDFQKHWKTTLLNYPNDERKKILSHQPIVIKVQEKKLERALDYAIISATPIHWLCKLGMSSFLNAMLKTFDDSFLHTLPGNTTPLHFAAGYGQLATVKLLLHHGVDVNVKSSLRIDDNLSSIGEFYTGFTPLLYACRENHVEVVECLLENGANPDLVRDHGGSPLLITADRGHHLVIKKLLQHNADPKICCEHGTSPLSLASQEGHNKSAMTLLDGGASIDHKKPSGMSPLSVAVKKDHIDTVVLLLNRGANIHIADNEGNTPLHIAVQARRIDIAKLLLDRGANPTLPNRGGHSARSMSLEMDETPLIKILHGLPVGCGKS